MLYFAELASVSLSKPCFPRFLRKLSGEKYLRVQEDTKNHMRQFVSSNRPIVNVHKVLSSDVLRII